MIKHNFKAILLVLTLFPIQGFSQEKAYYITDNSYHDIFRKLKVKSVKVYTKEYEDGKLDEEYLEMIQDFSKDGDIIKEREYMGEDQSDGWEVTYEYNDHHQITKSVWLWYDDKLKEKAIHQYDSNQKLAKTCEYSKEEDEEQYKLTECQMYQYKNGALYKVVNPDGSLISRYENEGGIVVEYDDQNKIDSKYQHGELIYTPFDDFVYTYYRNSIGQLTKSVKTGLKGKYLGETVFEYDNRLLMKVVSKDANGKTEYTEKYVYEYYE